MGFLDNSTNNIIVDAVLTDLGRKQLAAGTFVPVTFAFGDDEVDYTMIKKFGRTIGKQKIELNTPVFEAQTNNKYGLKYKLLSFNNPELGFIPNLVASPTTLTLQTNAANARTSINITQTTGGVGGQDNSEVTEVQLIVTYNSRFLNLGADAVSGTASNSEGFVQSLVTFTGGGNGTTLNFTPKNLNQQDFDFYGNPGLALGQGTITTLVTIEGRQTGARLNLEVTINQAAQ